MFFSINSKKFRNYMKVSLICHAYLLWFKLKRCVIYYLSVLFKIIIEFVGLICTWNIHGRMYSTSHGPSSSRTLFKIIIESVGSCENTYHRLHRSNDNFEKWEDKRKIMRGNKSFLYTWPHRFNCDFEKWEDERRTKRGKK
jgi:hypothetical protein